MDRKEMIQVLDRLAGEATASEDYSIALVINTLLGAINHKEENDLAQVVGSWMVESLKKDRDKQASLN